MRFRRLAPIAASILALTALSACTEPTGKPPVRPGGDPASVQPCSPVELIAARGSLEPQEGSPVIGPVVTRLQRDIAGATAYQVRYPASTDFATGVPLGAGDLVNHLVAQAAACPQQRFVLLGYSQGAMVLHHAFDAVPDAAFDRVAAVALFGSPYYKADSPASVGPARGANGTYEGRQPAKWESRTISFCSEQDIVCGAGSSVAAHYSYGRYAEQVSTFVRDKLA